MNHSEAIASAVARCSLYNKTPVRYIDLVLNKWHLYIIQILLKLVRLKMRCVGKQLDGSFTVKNNPGVTISIGFPVERICQDIKTEEHYA
jgi:hypothetical protein